MIKLLRNKIYSLQEKILTDAKYVNLICFNFCVKRFFSDFNLSQYCNIQKGLFHKTRLQCRIVFFNVGPPRENFFPGHLLSPIFQSSITVILMLDSKLGQNRMAVFEDCHATTLTTQPSWLVKEKF